MSDLISRQAAIKAADSIIERDTSGNNDVANAMKAWKEYIKALPPAQLAQDLPNGCTDTISRTAAIETVRKAQSIGQAHRMLVQLPPAQPVVISKSENTTECEDAVSREAVLNEIHRYMEERDYTIGLLDDNVCGLPPVTPKQPGWIPVTDRLPDKSGLYLVTEHTAYGVEVHSRYWNLRPDGSFWSGWHGDEVLAWQPLPTPYREGGQE